MSLVFRGGAVMCAAIIEVEEEGVKRRVCSSTTCSYLDDGLCPSLMSMGTKPSCDESAEGE